MVRREVAVLRRISLHNPLSPPTLELLAKFLTEQGEPFEAGGDGFRLRALPLRLDVVDEGVDAAFHVDPSTPLVRLVDLLFDLSLVSGADVASGGRTWTRPSLWAALADDQDRQRITRALDQADERGIKDEVLRRLWAIIHALRPGLDARWSAERHAIVTVDDAGNLGEPEGFLHIAVWRWLSEAYPSLAEEP